MPTSSPATRRRGVRSRAITTLLQLKRYDHPELHHPLTLRVARRILEREKVHLRRQQLPEGCDGRAIRFLGHRFISVSKKADPRTELRVIAECLGDLWLHLDRSHPHGSVPPATPQARAEAAEIGRRLLAGRLTARPLETRQLLS